VYECFGEREKLLYMYVSERIFVCMFQRERVYYVCMLQREYCVCMFQRETQRTYYVCMFVCIYEASQMIDIEHP
jgi:hypothetical protein